MAWPKGRKRGFKAQVTPAIVDEIKPVLSHPDPIPAAVPADELDAIRRRIMLHQILGEWIPRDIRVHMKLSDLPVVQAVVLQMLGAKADKNEAAAYLDAELARS